MMTTYKFHVDSGGFYIYDSRLQSKNIDHQRLTVFFKSHKKAPGFPTVVHGGKGTIQTQMLGAAVHLSYSFVYVEDNNRRHTFIP